MNLHEEYIRRHKLSVPVIQYKQNSKIFLRNESSHNWRILSFDWRPDYGHPGYWLSSLLEPIHASYGKERNWRQLFRPRQIYWDQYESFVQSMAIEHSGWKAVENRVDYELFCWEILLYTCDNWFSQNMKENKVFLKNMVSSIDKKLSLEDRWASFQEALLIVQNLHLQLVEFYSYNICNHYGGDSQWFSELINNESKKLFAIAG